MKTILTSAILLFALAYSSVAQPPQQRNPRQPMTPEQQVEMQTAMAKRQTDQMKERLKLDEDQEKAIGEINLKYAVLRTTVMEMARNQEDADLSAMLKELEDKHNNEILPFLNEDQVEPYYLLKKEQDEEQERRRQQMREGGGPRGDRPQGQGGRRPRE